MEGPLEAYIYSGFEVHEIYRKIGQWPKISHTFGDGRNRLGKEMLKNDGCALRTPIEQRDLRLLNCYWQVTQACRQPGPQVCCPFDQAARTVSAAFAAIAFR